LRTEVATKRISLIFAIIFTIGNPFLGYFTLGFAGTLFSFAFVGGLIVWVLTTYRTPVDPQKFIFPYLVSVILFLVLVYEEYLTHIEVLFSKLAGSPVTQTDFLTIAAFAAPIVWLLGAALTVKRWPLGYFFASSFLIAMMIGMPTHLLFPFLENGTFHYASGMYTFIFPVVGGWYTFILIMRERKKILTAQKEGKK